MPKLVPQGWRGTQPFKIDTINPRFRISLCGQRIQFNFGGKLVRQTRKISIFTPFQVGCSSRFIVVNVLDVVRKFEVTDLNWCNWRKLNSRKLTPIFFEIQPHYTILTITICFYFVGTWSNTFPASVCICQLPSPQVIVCVALQIRQPCCLVRVSVMT